MRTFSSMQKCILTAGLAILLSMALCSCASKYSAMAFHAPNENGVPMLQAESESKHPPHFKDGMRTLKEWKLRSARYYFEQSVKFNEPGCGGAFGLGLVSLLLEEYDGAASIYHKLAEENPEMAQAWAAWGYALYLSGESGKSLDKFSRAVELQPGYYEALNDWGSALLEQGKDKEALEKFSLAVKYEPGFAPAWKNSGDVLKKMGRPAKAAGKYESATRCDSKNPAVWSAWGSILYELGKYREAAEKYSRAVKLSPNDFYVWQNWGNVLTLLGFHEDAEIKYDRASQLDPLFEEEWGKTCFGDTPELPEEAMEKPVRTVKYKPADAQGWYRWGNCLEDEEKYESAAVKYEQAVLIEPDYSRAWKAWGDMLKKQGKPEEAREKYEKARN